MWLKKVMCKRKIGLFYTLVLLICVCPAVLFAYPSIVLYVDGGSNYFFNNADLAAPVGDIMNISYNEVSLFNDLNLVASVPEVESGSLNVFNNPGYLTSVDFGTAFDLLSQSVVSVDYFSYNTENNMNEQIILNVAWSDYSRVQFDAVGYDGTRWEGNPFSRDLIATDNPTRESKTLLLWGMGLLGVLGGFARRRFRELKRLLDIVGASIGLLLLVPVFFVIGILIKLDSKGPIFYKQMRVGKNRRRKIKSSDKNEATTIKCALNRRMIDSPGRLFKIYKFRTMKLDAEAGTGPMWAQKNDTRITKLGRFLRNSHLDELPQLINVIKGEMSLVGPRPERLAFVDMFRKFIPKYNKRLKVVPGITGLAQVRYKYDESADDVKRKLRYDLLYIKNEGWIGEIRVLLWTVSSMLTGKGAH